MFLPSLVHFTFSFIPYNTLINIPVKLTIVQIVLHVTLFITYVAHLDFVHGSVFNFILLFYQLLGALNIYLFIIF